MDEAKFAELFGLDQITDISEISCGHINQTRVLTSVNGERFVMQTLNTDVFRSPEAVMRNIGKITKKISASPNCGIIVPEYLFAGDGKNHAEQNGRIYRIYRYIAPTNVSEFPEYRTAKAYGTFIRMLSGKNLKLETSVENFHNYPCYFSRLASAEKSSYFKKIDKAVMKRLGSLSDTLSQVFTVDFPKRNIHGDAKKDNIILSETPAVIDLDTAMYSYAAIDYGDIVRSVCSSGKLDYCALRDVTRGFADGLEGLLSEDEIYSLYYGILYVTGELAVRYLTDYLSDEKYFRGKTSAQCLSRAESLLTSLKLFISEGEEIVSLIYRIFGMRNK